MIKKLKYSNKGFLETRTDLINFVRQYYPTLLNDFNDASIASMLIDLNAGITDVLSFNTDRAYQETQIDFAQERNSVLNIARTFGLKLPNKRPSITIVDFSVIVPVLGDSFDISYCPIIKSGVQVSGGGKVFESVDDIDFSSPFTTGGLPNRLIIPNLDSNNNLINYTITKREFVINGVTKIFKKIVTNNDKLPFLEVILPDSDVLSISNIISLEGTDFNSNPTSDVFNNFDNRWFEMDSLAEDKIFIEDSNSISDNSGVKGGKWVRVNKKFISEFTNNGFKKIIFGGGFQDTSYLNDFNSSQLINSIGNFVNNYSLGESPKINETIFIKYRVGGGVSSNLGSNVISTINVMDMLINGSNQTINLAVRNSLKINNPIPAIGGKDSLSVNEIKNLIKYNFSSQNRAVTIKDYEAIITKMPGQFGVPFRCKVHEQQNKIIVSILGLNNESKLTNYSTNTLKENIATYLSDYRMLNDYVEVINGRIINIGLEIDVFIDKEFSSNDVIGSIISKVGDYFDINNQEMGVNIYLSQLLEIINNVPGVLNVIDLRVFNKVGGGIYSMNEISQPYLDVNTKQIDLLGEYTLFGVSNSMFEILNVNKDIKVRVK
jgi:hypothetical protein